MTLPYTILPSGCWQWNGPVCGNNKVYPRGNRWNFKPPTPRLNLNGKTYSSVPHYLYNLQHPNNTNRLYNTCGNQHSPNILCVNPDHYRTKVHTAPPKPQTPNDDIQDLKEDIDNHLASLPTLKAQYPSSVWTETLTRYFPELTP